MINYTKDGICVGITIDDENYYYDNEDVVIYAFLNNDNSIRVEIETELDRWFCYKFILNKDEGVKRQLDYVRDDIACEASERISEIDISDRYEFNKEYEYWVQVDDFVEELFEFLKEIDVNKVIHLLKEEE